MEVDSQLILDPGVPLIHGLMFQVSKGSCLQIKSITECLLWAPVFLFLFLHIIIQEGQ